MPLKIFFRCLLGGIAIFITNNIFTMVYDNRFLPLLGHMRIAPDATASYFAADFIMGTASEGCLVDDRSIGLSEIYGYFDQGMLAQAMVALGFPDPLLPEWQNQSIQWRIDGKLQMQGFAFEIQQKILDCIYVGATWVGMRVHSYHNYHLNRESSNELNAVSLILSPSDEQQLDEIRRSMFTTLNLYENGSTQIGFGDIDLYLRLGGQWDYMLKCHRIRAGLRAGMLAPTGITQDITMPPSIAFGGNGHWGIYGAFDGLIEFREDMKAGLYTRLSKRFARTSEQRVPTYGEPQIFAAKIAEVTVNPGITFVFNPYVVLESLRQGFGMTIGATIVNHAPDSWSILCAAQDNTNAPEQSEQENQTASSSTSATKKCNQFEQVERRSQWSSNYININVFYDFAKDKVDRELSPIFMFRWDIPWNFFDAKRSFRTNRISLGVEFDF